MSPLQLLFSFSFCRFIRPFIHSLNHSVFAFLPFLFYSLQCCCICAAAAVVDVVLTNLFTIRMKYILCMHYRSYVLAVYLSFFLSFFHNKFPSLWNHFRYLYISECVRELYRVKVYKPYAVHVRVYRFSLMCDCVLRVCVCVPISFF